MTIIVPARPRGAQTFARFRAAASNGTRPADAIEMPASQSAALPVFDEAWNRTRKSRVRLRAFARR